MAAITSIVAACSQAPAPVPQSVPIANTPATAPQRHQAEDFVHPVPGARISSSFANYIVKSRNRKHHGTDFAAPTGTPVYAARSGVVLSADNTSLSGDFGNAVLIEHGDQFQSLSAHLSRIDVQMGTWVEAGQQIGLVGKTGRATGAHLHFEMWQNNVPKDPLQFLPIEESQRLAVQKPQAAPIRVAKAETAKVNRKPNGTKSLPKSVTKKAVANTSKRTSSSKAVTSKTKAKANAVNAQKARSKSSAVTKSQRSASAKNISKTNRTLAKTEAANKVRTTAPQRKSSKQESSSQQLRKTVVASPNDADAPRKQPDRPR